MFGIIALNVHNHAVGELEAVIVIGGNKCFFLEHTACNHWLDLWVFCLYRRLASVKQWNFPIASSARPLAADDELVWLTGFLIDAIGDDGSHNRTDKTDAHYYNDFFALASSGFYQQLNASELRSVLILLWNRELFAFRTY
ncbi:hypothetical protein ES703_73398 [subsurface metagenome]